MHNMCSIKTLISNIQAIRSKECNMYKAVGIAHTERAEYASAITLLFFLDIFLVNILIGSASKDM